MKNELNCDVIYNWYYLGLRLSRKRVSIRIVPTGIRWCRQDRASYIYREKWFSKNKRVIRNNK